jgi:hypothetical protein
MLIKLKQLIYKYELVRRDCIDKGEFHEAKMAKDIIADLNKLVELQEKQNGC